MKTESLEETVIYSKAKLSEEKLNKEIKKNRKKRESLQKKATILKQLPYLEKGEIQNAKEKEQ